jgi:hypothetical protein
MDGDYSRKISKESSEATTRRLTVKIMTKREYMQEKFEYTKEIIRS